MSRKTFGQVLVLGLMMLALLAVPAGARAGANACGSTYVVQQGDTLDEIAEMCSTTVSALYAANPGLSGILHVGQVLTIPVGATPTAYSSTYIVQEGDTFSEIADNFGVSVNELQAANPQIWDITYLVPGQVVFVPYPSAIGTATPSGASFVIVPDSSSGVTTPPPPVSFQIVPNNYPPYWWFTYVPTPTEESVPLSYGSGKGAPNKTIQLINQAHGQVYVSLQGTLHNGDSVIREYPVGGTTTVKIPVAWYAYVAWVGGQKFEGSFNLGGDSTHSITFYSNRVVIQ